MALFFILFIPFTFICVMVIKSSMNYEFGSDRRKRTVRLSVVAATLAVVIAHYIMATGLMEFIWAGPTRDDPAATLVIHFAAATTGTLIWGFIVPKVVFSFVGTKPLGADKPDQTQQYIEQSTPLHEHERPIQPETARQQTQTHEAQLYPWEEETPKKSKKSILIGAGALALLSVGAIAVLTFMLTGGSPSRTTLANCDASTISPAGNDDYFCRSIWGEVPLITAIEAETYGRQDTGNGSGQGWDERAFSAQVAEWAIAVWRTRPDPFDGVI